MSSGGEGGGSGGRRVKAKLTGDDLVAIEVRARSVVRGAGNSHQRQAVAYQVCAQDVPDLLVEIRRLRATRPAPTSEGGEGGRDE